VDIKKNNSLSQEFERKAHELSISFLLQPKKKTVCSKNISLGGALFCLKALVLFAFPELVSITIITKFLKPLSTSVVIFHFPAPATKIIAVKI
jgi:hypothetical protein